MDSSLYDDLFQIMQHNTEAVCEAHPPGTFGRVFWETQMLPAASLNDARQMRWDPVMVQWCLYLRHLSSSAYEMIRESDIIKLRSQRTLRDYTYHTKAVVVGFSTQVDQHLFTIAKLPSSVERDKCVIIFYEMHLRQDLTFDKHSTHTSVIWYLKCIILLLIGGLTGFVDIGDINNHLSQYEGEVCNDDIRDSLATFMLVLMIRRLFLGLRFPYAISLH